MSLEKSMMRWRDNWEYDRNKHELGTTYDIDWEDYIDSLSMFEVLDHLICWEGK